MPLCHLKNSELDKMFWKYKGRVVFRGDIVKDENGYLAVFSEQGTSASHLSAAKMLDALARCDGMDGEDADACSAYTQTSLGKDPLGIIDCEFKDVPETWISLPRDQ